MDGGVGGFLVWISMFEGRSADRGEG